MSQKWGDMSSSDEEKSYTSQSSSFSSITSLSALTSNLDANPNIPIEHSDFVDAFKTEDMEDIIGIIGDAEEDFKFEELKNIGGNDFIDLFEAFAMDVPEKDDTYPPVLDLPHVDFTDIPKGERVEKELIHRSYSKGPYVIYTFEGDEHVYLSSAQDNQIVGISRRSTSFSYDISTKNYFEVANGYAEEVGGKGVNLGFSNFYHSVTILMLAQNSEGVIEPHDGHDYASGGITFEVTGQNFQRRKTTADVIINKYLINPIVNGDFPYAWAYMMWSWNEDSGSVQSFYGTAFDAEETLRSREVRKISRLIPKITDKQRRRLGRNYRAYCHCQGIPKEDPEAPNREFGTLVTDIEALIHKGCKEHEGSYFAPCPFRVVYPKGTPKMLSSKETDRRQSLQVLTIDWGDSTYHTWHADDDPRPILLSQSEDYPEKATGNVSSLHDGLYESLKRYVAFSSSIIQAALLPKIVGKGGCFYDRFNRVGITWYRKNSNSLTWTCNYYTFEHPGSRDLIGDWYFNKNKEIYIGPTFLVSRQDIHYASILPAKIACVLAAVRTLVSPSEYPLSEAKIISAMGVQSNSTWMTSHWTGINRFFTCCHVSDSGNLPALIEGQLSYSNRHRFCDYLMLMHYKFYIIERPSNNRTPFFRLPFALMSYEKDFSQTLQWHMRDTDHDTKCMVKVTEAAKRHALEEQETNSWMHRQYEFLKKMLQEGVTGEEYKQLISSAPSFPTMNIVAFIGMCNIVSEEIKDIGSIQHSVGFNIWSMITDRHCIEYKGKRNGIQVVRSSKVVESMSKYLCSIGGVTGGYELIAKMAFGGDMPENLLLNHSKDGKENDREISQMMPQSRIKQNLPEALTETFTGNNTNDMMSDPAKYNKHVEATMTPEARGKAMHASEDRSKFCQEQEPQLQALGLSAISMEANSTCLRTAAAMTLMNRTRTILYPHLADHDLLIGDHPSGKAVIESGKEKHFTKTITIEKNMTQGLGAVTAGAMNDIYVVSHAKIFKGMVPGFENIASDTTSDDVKRSGINNSQYSHDSVHFLYRTIPNRNLHFAMMMANTKKPIHSKKLSEFNNVVATTTGMVSQAPIFATLTIQPLLSKSMFGDITTIVNASRSTISWGCPPDVMQCGMFAMIRVLRQKWLISDDEMETIWLSGLLPSDASKHIAGFWIRNEDIYKRLYGQLDQESRDDLENGRVTIYDALKKCELDLGRKSKKKKMTVADIPGLRRANKVKETILSQRLVSERLYSRFVQPIPISKRLEAKKRFFSMLKAPVEEFDMGVLNKYRPPKVMIHVRSARASDRLPCTLGTSSQLDVDSLQRVRAYRYYGVNYRDNLSDTERETVSLIEEDFEKKVQEMERSPRYQGLSFKSPCGKPFTRVFDNRIFMRPATMDFTVDLEQTEKLERPFTFKGRTVRDFKPCLYGTNSLNIIGRPSNRSNIVLAFGRGYIDGEFHIFFKRKKKNAEVRSTAANESGPNLSLARLSDCTVYYLRKVDATPLLTSEHKSEIPPYMPGVVGDNDAMLNYGMFCRSNATQGFAVYKSLFRNYKSTIPDFVIKHMPIYPMFLPNSEEIARGEMTVFRGVNCINKLKLIIVENAADVVKVDLTGIRPVKEGDNLLEEYIDL